MAGESSRQLMGAGPAGRPARPSWAAALLTLGYALTAAGWMAFSGALLWSEVVTSTRATVIIFVNAALFLVFTSSVLFVVMYRYLRQLRNAEAHYVAAQVELRQKDLAVRQGYVDVLDAVTGGKLILITEDELRATLGPALMEARRFEGPKSVSQARRAIAEQLSGIEFDDKDAFMLATSEALTNAVKHGGGGEYSVHVAGDCIQVTVRDFGPGIDFRELPKATLIQGFSTTSTMGMGFTIMLEVCDRVLLTTDTTGTVVVLELRSPPMGEGAEERSLESILSVA